MRLRAITPPLPEEFLDALEDHGIKTDSELLFSGDAVDIWRKLPDGSITLHDLENILSRIAAQQAAPMVRGDELLGFETNLQERRTLEPLSSGVEDLDKLVGGFGRHRLLEISGDRGSGKTALALQICMRHLSEYPDSTVIWIDTTGDFSVDSVPQASISPENTRDESSALERLQVSLAFDLEAARELLDTLQYSLNVDPKPKIRCIVIDSITPYFRPLLSATSSQGHSIMTTFMRRLRLFAEMHSLTVLVINSTSMASPRNLEMAFAFTNRKPALGPSFTYMTDATLWLARMDERRETEKDLDPVHLAEVMRSRIAPRHWCPFRIREGALIPFA